MKTTQNRGGWIASSFDDFTEFGQSHKQTCDKQTSRKRARGEDNPSSSGSLKSLSNKTKSKKKIVADELWAEKYSPQNSAELGVHKKKISELQGWLEFSLQKKQAQPPMMLLTGPSGTGKTATVLVLAKEMGIEVQEWVNPTTSSSSYSSFGRDDWGRSSSGYDDFIPVGGRTSESQAVQFQDFLLRANKYQTLQIFSDEHFQKKLILVEDFPNVFFKDVPQFHNILRTYHRKGRCPLVFIVSDSAGGDSNERLLFPKDFQAEINLFNLSFNPIALTSMVKVLTRIATSEAAQGSSRLRVPSKATLEALSNASSGDIRGAINALQFACLKDTTDLDEVLKGGTTLKKSTSKKSSGSQRTLSVKGKLKTKDKKSKTSPDEREETLSAIGGRDTSLFLFRALGKILYCKRGDPGDFPDHRSLPPSVDHLNRDPLLVIPEEVIEKSQLSGDFFTAFLHQNYLDFYAELDDAVNASEYFSDADYLSVDWTNRTALSEYSASLATRGLMFFNTTRAKSSGSGSSGLGFKALHKPQWFSVMKKARENREAARALFRRCGHTPIELQTQFLPYVNKISSKLFIESQNLFIREAIGWKSMKFSRVFCERLDEKEVDLRDEESEDIPVAGPVCVTGQEEEEEEEGEDITVQEDEDIVIEDFDD